MKRLKLQGVSVIFISHALEEALDVSDRITVLRDGQHVITADTKDMDRDKIIRAMVGRTPVGRPLRPPRERAPLSAERCLSVENLTMGRMVRSTSFSIYAGQITGIFGLVGSGRTETAKVVAGVLKRDLFHGGRIEFEGHPVRFRTPREAVKRGIVYVTEDRKLEGFFETMTVGENIFVNMLGSDKSNVQIVHRGGHRCAGPQLDRCTQGARQRRRHAPSLRCRAAISKKSWSHDRWCRSPSCHIR